MLQDFQKHVLSDNFLKHFYLVTTFSQISFWPRYEILSYYAEKLPGPTSS